METDSDIKTLIEATVRLCNQITQLMLRSEERAIKVNQICEAQCETIHILATESKAHRRMVDKQAETTLRDRNQIKEQYEALVREVLRNDEEERREMERNRDILKILIAQLGNGTTINNK